jgi:hypothetical protein
MLETWKMNTFTYLEPTKITNRSHKLPLHFKTFHQILTSCVDILTTYVTLKYLGTSHTGITWHMPLPLVLQIKKYKKKPWYELHGQFFHQGEYLPWSPPMDTWEIVIFTQHCWSL